MKKSTIVSVSLSFLISAGTLFADDKGHEIAKKYYDLKDPKTTSSKATMTITDKNGSQKSRTLQMYGKKDDLGTWSFIEFESPADVKGTKLLTIPKKPNENEQRIYLPALKKARLIASSGKGGKFVNTDFFYYDLESHEFEDYTYTYVKDDKLVDHQCSVVQMSPKSTDTPYLMSEAWISKEDNFVYQMKLYDRKTSEHIKTMNVLETSITDGCIIPVRILMTNHKDNSKTELSLSDLKVNSGVDDKVFSIQNLETR
ncbi:MAG: outer membrane lipoprotein-sorting protein [Fibrobacter sp.]|nr:outer membrane lipoprotein-sorting protein [Fibrobacter sp.]